MTRFEDHRLLVGAGSFVADIQLPELLHAVVVRSPHAHALIRSIDGAEAEALLGVAAVYTGADLDGVLTPIPTMPLWADESILVMNGPGQPVLAGDRACYVGQAVAIVVAETPELAQDAAGLVNVEYEPLPALSDPFAALQDNATPIHAEMGNNLGMHLFREGGELDAAFSKADRVVSQRYEVQRLAPAPLEPRGVAAHYQRQDDMLTVWDSTQEPHEVWEQIASQLGRPQAKVRVIAPDVGGGFGEKGAVYPEEILVPYLAIQLGRPIKWLEDRQENMLAFQARGHTVDVEAAAAEDGTILGMKVQIVADLGAYFLSATAAVPMLAGQRIAGPYKTPAMQVEVKGALTNKPPTGPYRGAGGPESAFCMERTVELIAWDLGLDPVEVRRKNFIPNDGFPHETPTGLTYDSGDYERGMDRVLELADYQAWREKSRQQGADEPLLGVGLATVVKASGGGGHFLTEYARVEIDASGSVTAYTGLSPHGQGTETSFAQLVSRELGVDPAAVQVLHSDTAIVPSGHGTAASRGTVAGANALHVVLQEAREKLSLVAAPLLRCSPDEVVFGPGEVYAGSAPERTLAFSEVAAAAYSEESLPPEVSVGLDFSGTFTLPRTPFAFAAHVAVVEVDRNTGEVKIVHYAAVHDCGRIINPTLVDGQVHGAIAQGVGQALTEGMVYSPEGQPLTASFMDYAIPFADEFPNIVLDMIETPSPLNPLGAKGIGELPTVAAPVAVTNAVMDALSGSAVRHIDTPLTPEKIWRALHAGE
jgi:carbon-monoxide dehydrogenase large subunit